MLGKNSDHSMTIITVVELYINVCFKNNPVISSQITADLPREHVTPNFAFHVTGIDYCSTFCVKFKNQRKGVNKIYGCGVCIFMY